MPAAELLEHLAHTSRDHSRTPVQWTADAHGGFTTGTPWLAVNPNHVEINAAAQVADPESVFHHHRRLIELRRTHPVLVHGTFRDIDPDHEHVFAYTRTLGDVTALVVLHMGTETHEHPLPDGMRIGSTLLVSGAAPVPDATTLMLEGWHSSVHLLA